MNMDIFISVIFIPWEISWYADTFIFRSKLWKEKQSTCVALSSSVWHVGLTLRIQGIDKAKKLVSFFMMIETMVHFFLLVLWVWLVNYRLEWFKGWERADFHVGNVSEKSKFLKKKKKWLIFTKICQNLYFWVNSPALTIWALAFVCLFCTLMLPFQYDHGCAKSPGSEFMMI